MILYDIEYDLVGGMTLEESFNNVPRLTRAVKRLIDSHRIKTFPLEKQTAQAVVLFRESIKNKRMLSQFRVSVWDYDFVDGYGIPEYLGSKNLEKWNLGDD